ncbi:MAG: hydantoinase/oxoprolinase family protein, partial [Fimbriimonadales bacterium]
MQHLIERDVVGRNVAVDIGGTFTDLVYFDEGAGSTRIVKVPSTPGRFEDGVLQAVDLAGIPGSSIANLVHGATIGLNAVIEGKGARTGLVTTIGFRDVYEIGRTNKPVMYDSLYRKPRPLVPRRWRFEVDERIDTNGDVVRAPSRNQVAAIAERIRLAGLGAVAVCLINSYVNPTHESIVGRWLQELCPTISISLSYVVWNEWREYERTSTVALNAYVQPLVAAYLTRLEARLTERGHMRPLRVMRSNGGVMDAGIAKVQALHTLQSGPVGGVIGAVHLGSLIHSPNLVTMDIGGTSCDVSLIVGNSPEFTAESNIRGLPMLLPSIKIENLGAGGGSIARVVAGSALRVGPESAGAVPGPACYGRGGSEPTVTDANVVLGRLQINSLPDSSPRLQSELAIAAIRANVAAPLGMSINEAAEGIIAIVNAGMANAIREITVGQGLSPADFVLFAFGGGGPLHAASLASEVGMRRVIIPPSPGVFSAWGMMFADFRQDIVRTLVWRADDTDTSSLDAEFRALEAAGADLLAAQRIPVDRQEMRRLADVRYKGQE